MVPKTARPSHEPARVVLGKGVLGFHNKDAQDIFVPTFLGPVPKTLGVKGRGKLKSDEWRSGCTISLALSLIRQWGRASGRHGEYLKNFLHLVIAVRIGARRNITEEAIQKYEYHIQEHLRGLRELYPDMDLTSKQHALLHIASFFRGFGPASGFWCFHFERFNGDITKLNSNYKSGKLNLRVYPGLI